MKHRAPVIALTILATAAVGGCTTSTPGAAGGTTSTPPTQTTSAPASTASGPLARVDPCSLLDQSVISTNHLQQTKTGTQLGSRFCQWNTANGVGYAVSIDIYDTAGLDQLNTTAFDVTSYPLSHHQGRMSKEKSGDVCSIAMGVTSTSRVDLSATDDAGQQAASCTIATTLAPAVEQKLPATSGG